MNEAVEKAFEDAKNADLTAVMIIGMTESGININSSVNNTAVMHWMLNKSIFDINVFERQPKEEKSPQAVDPEA